MVKHISQFIKEGPIFVEILLNSLYTGDVNAGKAKKICRPWFWEKCQKLWQNEV